MHRGKRGANSSILGNRGYPPSPSIYWNQWIRGKRRAKSCGSVACGQNPVFKGLKPRLLAADPTGSVSSMMDRFRVRGKVRCHTGGCGFPEESLRSRQGGRSGRTAGEGAVQGDLALVVVLEGELVFDFQTSGPAHCG